jgi:hypothetical protein
MGCRKYATIVDPENDQQAACKFCEISFYAGYFPSPSAKTKPNYGQREVSDCCPTCFLKILRKGDYERDMKLADERERELVNSMDSSCDSCPSYAKCITMDLAG